LIDKALHDAELAANAEEKIVFAPPIATFKKGYFAREDNLAEGLVINAECDTHAQEARAKLERLLGPATVVVESGGEWVDPDTGELKPRLHVHYRLKVPARGEEALAKLRLARKLATAIVGGDASNINAVHPIRWAGSWHRKGEPKLARIVSLNADAEIDLDEALEILQQAAPSVECAEPASNEDKQADPDLIYAAMVVIPNNDVSRDEWNKKGMAIFAATGGHQRGFEAFAMWSKKSSKSHGGHVKRWKNYRRHPPTKISAGSIIYWANEADPTGQWRADYDKKREAIDAKLVEPLLANFAAKQAAAEPKDEAKVDEPIGIKDASDPWPTINEAAY
jgi:primase-like protein